MLRRLHVAWVLLCMCLLQTWGTTTTSTTATTTSTAAVLTLRGGLVPQANEAGGDYYEQFELDYGSADKRRVAGALRGFIKSGKIGALPASDPFLKWLNENLEKGPETPPGRLKPFYAADFGKKSDLKAGEHPQVIIVQRRLEADEDGILAARPPSDIDVEVRHIWQPWLRARCNFAVRYIVPSRVNIIKILENKRRFGHEVEVDTDGEDGPKLWAKMTFKPRLVGRLLGKRNKVMWRQLDVDVGAGTGAGATRPTAAAATNPATALLRKAQSLLNKKQSE